AGENAAAHVAGAMTLPDALRVAFHRGRLQHRASGMGTMLAVGMPAEAVSKMLAAYHQRVSIAAVNSPTSVTLSREREALQELMSAFEQQQVAYRALPVDVPYHGPQMEHIRDEFLHAVGGLASHPPAIPVFSSMLGTWSNGQPFDADYWWQNIRRPV